MTARLDPQAVAAFVLALVRAAAFVFVAPPFHTRLVPLVVKLGLSAALAVGAVPILEDQTLPVQTGPFIWALLTQVAVGLALGFVVLLLFSAVQAAGGFIDLSAGYGLAATLDPFSESSSSAIFSRFYSVIATTLLFASGGYLLMVQGFYRSFDAVPLDAETLGAFAALLTRDIGMFFVAALEIAGPVVACLFITELTIGLLARAAPNLNIFVLAFPLRVLVTLLVTAVALPLVVPSLSNLLQHALSGLLGG